MVVDWLLCQRLSSNHMSVYTSMNEPTLPLRLCIKLQSYQVTWDPSFPAEKLLQHACKVSKLPLTGLYNVTRGYQMDLAMPLGNSVKANDVVEATTLLEIPENGLFYQQLRAMAVVGRREQSQVDLQKKIIQKQTDHLISLMKLYLKTTEDTNCLPEYQTYIRRTRQKEADPSVSSPILTAKPVPISPINDFSAFSDSEDEDLEEMPQEITPTQDKSKIELPVDVFEIVFMQKAIGLKLIMDDTKRFVIVRECMNDSEAIKYSDIYPGVMILAVNGESVEGIGLSRTLTRLRDAPRPLVVRFGHPNKLKLGSWNDTL